MDWYARMLDVLKERTLWETSGLTCRDEEVRAYAGQRIIELDEMIDSLITEREVHD